MVNQFQSESNGKKCGKYVCGSFKSFTSPQDESDQMDGPFICNMIGKRSHSCPRSLRVPRIKFESAVNVLAFKAEKIQRSYSVRSQRSCTATGAVCKIEKIVYPVVYFCSETFAPLGEKCEGRTTHPLTRPLSSVALLQCPMLCVESDKIS